MIRLDINKWGLFIVIVLKGLCMHLLGGVKLFFNPYGKSCPCEQKKEKKKKTAN